jgi:hypothetical protein
MYRGARYDVAELLLEPLLILHWDHPEEKMRTLSNLPSNNTDAQWSARIHVDVERKFVVEIRGCFEHACVSVAGKSRQTDGIDSSETMNGGIELF